ncbi:feruloyl esterase b precursor [Fusarium mexicanum]|uniref:Carboxylic ester hydrolase n=1 Tax=Fusarium mexicanum TaxID=751941 RepID=A0A8H5I5I6_9HYPO|nr:feruloyl esterase b precursor [Fusarium mexicanum]
MVLLYLLFAYLVTGAVLKSPDCSPHSLRIPSPFGTKIQSITASPVNNYSIFVPQNGANPTASTNFTDLSFCNVTVTYTHPGQKGKVHVRVWLPFEWNGRFQVSGGGGWAAGLGAMSLAPGVALKYATATTDAGHSETDLVEFWALDSPGNVNLNALQDFAATALGDMAAIGKAVTKRFYNKSAKYSYWNGCSTGGREGFMLVQRFPEAFDGVLAYSPVINWAQVPTSTYWPQQVMKDLNYYPLPCEMAAITARAIQACDELDGVRDSIISYPDQCKFDAHALIGNSFNCDGRTLQFSSQAAIIANAAWNGPRSPSGSPLWYGIGKEARFMGIANTTCTGDTCTGAPFQLGADWIKYFLAKDPQFSFANMTQAEYARLFHNSVQQYESIIGTDDPDLSEFRDAGGKMIAVHGLADELIPVNGTIDYYNNVESGDRKVAEYFRFFAAPGMAHCASYVGPYPKDALASLVAWVERGEAPDTLEAIDPKGEIVRNLCAYPSQQLYIGGNPKKAGSFTCSK